MLAGEKTKRLARAGSTVVGIYLVLIGVSLLGGILAGSIMVGLACAGLGLVGILTGVMVIARRPRWRIVGIGYAALLISISIYSMASHGWDLAVFAVGVISSFVVIGVLVLGRSTFTAIDMGITVSERSARAWAISGGVLLVLGGLAVGFMGFLTAGFSEDDEMLGYVGLALMGLGLAGLLIGVLVIKRRPGWRVIGMGYASLALILTAVEVVSMGEARAEMWGFWVAQAIPPAIVITALVLGKAAFTHAGPGLPPRPDVSTPTPALPGPA